MNTINLKEAIAMAIAQSSPSVAIKWNANAPERLDSDPAQIQSLNSFLRLQLCAIGEITGYTVDTAVARNVLNDSYTTDDWLKEVKQHVVPLLVNHWH